MSTEYIIQQGDTLLRIAKQHGFTRSDTIYDHPSNEAFRSLRPNPNILYAGDKINIPEAEPLVQVRSSGSRYSFTVKKPEVEKFSVKFQNKSGDLLKGKRIILSIGDQDIDVELGDDGLLEVDLPNGDEREGELNVFMDPNSEEPTHIFTIQLGHLDPIEELSGVQARCNLLGHDCGIADGIMGAKTRDGITSFQTAHNIEATGEPDELTQKKLNDVYGC